MTVTAVRSGEFSNGENQLYIAGELLDSTAGRRLKSLLTIDGDFDFESAAPGLYFLSLTSGLRGLVPVVVDSGAPTDHLDVDVGSTSCGMWYADQSKCPHSDVLIDQLSGQVLDASEASIANAQILLFDLAGALVERLQSNREGKFTSTHRLAGTYQLVVSTPGFTPLRRTIHAESPNPTQALTVQLGLMGSCSAANATSQR